MLSSWKEIAHFFGKGVRTVQRWEKTLDLPIHRPPGAPSNVVLARTSDLEEWMHRGPIARSTDEAVAQAPSTEVLAQLNRLEAAVQQLLQTAGMDTVTADTSLPVEERVAAAADLVQEAASHMGGEQRSVRAA